MQFSGRPFDLANQQANSPQVKAPDSINWNDYNFPPLLRVVHFTFSELQGRVKKFVVKAYSSFMIVVAVLLINRIFFKYNDDSYFNNNSNNKIFPRD